MTTAISDAGLQFSDGSLQPSAAVPQIHSVGATVASNTLTVTLNPCSLAFRSTTLTSGTPTYVTSASQLSLTVPLGATLGTVSGVAAQLVLVALNNAGTMVLGIVNLSGGLNLDESSLVTTTTISASATAANIIYTAATLTNVTFRVVGIISITETTAGTWASAPTLVQGLGGIYGTAMQSLGYGQTWVSGLPRSAGTTYYNTTGRPIVVSTFNNGTTTAGTDEFSVNGVVVCEAYHGSSAYATMTVTVPVGASYTYTLSGTNGLVLWLELR